MSETIINLSPRFFTQREMPLVESGALSATAFQYATGVSAVRLQNGLGQAVLLPFQGQQIWALDFGGRNLAMKSMFPEPRPTRQYLESYGAFLVHCGATAMGVPTREDSHPLHGELPNAPYQEAHLVVGQDAEGEYIGLGGRYQHTVAFNYNYVAAPLVKMYAGSTLLRVSMAVRNLRAVEMELMYMAHANFRPAPNGRLVYSAPCTPEHVRVRTSVPSHVRVRPGYHEFLQDIGRHPERHHLLSAELSLDPELVFTIDYRADAQGWAHSLQMLPGGGADYIAHRPAQLDTGVRWMLRNDDHAALGIVLPATAGPEGYSAEKAKGKIKLIPPQGAWHAEIMLGALDASAAVAMEKRIAAILA